MRDWPTIPDLSRATGIPERTLHIYADEGILEIMDNTPKAKQENK
jgi:DNA-binding transcriptional MerR regulator